MVSPMETFTLVTKGMAVLTEVHTLLVIALYDTRVFNTNNYLIRFCYTCVNSEIGGIPSNWYNT